MIPNTIEISSKHLKTLGMVSALFLIYILNWFLLQNIGAAYSLQNVSDDAPISIIGQYIEQQRTPRRYPVLSYIDKKI